MNVDTDWQGALDSLHPALTAYPAPAGEDWRFSLGIAAALGALVGAFWARPVASLSRPPMYRRRMVDRATP
jgi:hypothetical protein